MKKNNHPSAEEIRNIKNVVRSGDEKFFRTLLRNSSSAKHSLHSHLIGELSVLNYAAIMGDREYVLEAFDMPRAEFDDFAKVSCAFAIVGLSYSTHQSPLQSELVYPLFEKSIAALDFEPRAKEIFLDVLEKINSGEKIKIANGCEIELLKSTVPNHASYFIIESNEAGPQRLSYCDSVFNLRRGVGETVFELDSEKLPKLDKKGREKFLKDVIFTPVLGADVIKSKLLKLVKCHDLEEGEGEEPIVFERNIPTNPQKRANCILKSLHILVRAVMQKIHPQEMSFSLDEGGVQQWGKGYDIYKNYKNSLRQNAIETLIDFAQEKYRGSITHAYALEGLQEGVFLQTIAKGDARLFSRVAETLLKNDVDIFAIKSSSGARLSDLVSNNCSNEYTLLNRPFYNLQNDVNRTQEVFAARVDFIGKLMNCGSGQDLLDLKSSFLEQGFTAHEIDSQGGTLLHQAIKFLPFVKIENNQIVSLKDLTVNFDQAHSFRSSLTADRLHFLIHDPEIDATNNIKDKNGQTPLMLLQEDGHYDLAQNVTKFLIPNSSIVVKNKKIISLPYEAEWQLSISVGK